MADQDAADRKERLMNVAAPFAAPPQSPELVQPTDGALHDPADRPQSLCTSRAPLGDHGLNAPLPQGQSMSHRIISLVRPQTLWSAARTTRFAGYRGNGVNEGNQLGDVSGIGPRDRLGHRRALSVDEDVMLRSALAAIRGVRPDLVPPKTARTLELSATVRDQSSLSAACSLLSNIWWRSSHTPASCQSRSRLQHVIPHPHPISLGKSSQGIPVRRTNTIPVSAARLSTGLRPGYRKRRGLTGGRSGSISAPNSPRTLSRAMFGPPCPFLVSTNRAGRNHSFH